jgi:PAS domain S-box-containing protein
MFVCVQTGFACVHSLWLMRAASVPPPDLRVVFHAHLSDSYELSNVLLARASFDGTLQLLTSGWERALGYRRRELAGKTLSQLMWSDRRSAAAAVAAILDWRAPRPVHLRVRCRDGRGRSFRLHRRYDRQEYTMYVVAEEISESGAGRLPDGRDRRAAARHC